MPVDVFIKIKNTISKRIILLVILTKFWNLNMLTKDGKKAILQKVYFLYR